MAAGGREESGGFRIPLAQWQGLALLCGHPFGMTDEVSLAADVEDGAAA